MGNYSKLNFNFEYKNRLIRSTFENNEYFKLDTPFLKVLKSIHVSSNKKKNTQKKYIILEINENYNVNKELDEFVIIINKLHETSQENIRKNSIKWFNTEFDDIGLDLKVKKPIDKQKEKQFIKILIPDDNEELMKKIESLEKNDYIMTTIFYKGLKVSNDYLMGEYELINFITQKEYEENKRHDDSKEDLNILNKEFIENIDKLEENIDNIERDSKKINENINLQENKNVKVLNKNIEDNTEDNTENNIQDNTGDNTENNTENNTELSDKKLEENIELSNENINSEKNKDNSFENVNKEYNNIQKKK